MLLFSCHHAVIFCSACCLFLFSAGCKGAPRGPASGISDDTLSFIPQTKKNPPVTSIQKISPVSYGPTLSSSSMISFEVLCCDLQVAQDVASICTQDNISAQVKRFRLPQARLVAEAEILEPCLEKSETMAELIASEAKVRILQLSID